ncbi:hypothetical protein Taro_002729, partial [Colocasia esculenta]|nr:hypothetical protein [Colocasia esculenta]
VKISKNKKEAPRTPSPHEILSSLASSPRPTTFGNKLGSAKRVATRSESLLTMSSSSMGTPVSHGRVEEFLATGEAGDPHTKPFFFPVVSAATCTDHHLEVDQRVLVSTLLELVSTHCPKSAQKATSVNTTRTSVDTLSQIGQKVFWELSLVSTPPDLVSTLLDLLPCI